MSKNEGKRYEVVHNPSMSGMNFTLWMVSDGMQKPVAQFYDKATAERVAAILNTWECINKYFAINLTTKAKGGGRE